jgi:phage I-like protein
MHLYAFGAPALLPVEPVEWIELCHVGVWKGYHSGNGVVTLTESDLHEMERNFRKDARQRVVIDYEHQTLKASDNGKPAPAAGWVTDLRVSPAPTGAKLEGKPAWTPSGDTHIRAQEYAYVSPVIVLRSKDRVTGQPEGKRLHSVALTNQPFFTELPAVAATELPSLSETRMLTLLLACMGLPADANEETVVASVKGLADGRKKVCATLGLPPEAAEADIAAKFSEVSRRAEIGAAVCSELQIADTEPAAAAIAKVKPVLGHAGYVAATDHTKVVDELRKVRVDQVVASAIADRKVVPATEPWAREFATRDLEGFRGWCAATSPVLPGPVDPTRKATGGAGKLSAEEIAYCSQAGIEHAAFLKAKGEEA